MDARTLRLALLLTGSALSLACAFDAGGVGDGADALGSTGETADTETSTVATTPSTPPTGPMTTTSTSSDPVPTTGAATTTDTSDPPPTETDDGGDSSGEPAAVGCPSPLPDGWIACRDFENGLDGLSMVAGPGISAAPAGFESDGAFRVTHTTNDNWVGSAALRFGAGPTADNVVDPAAKFDEVWLRFRTQTSGDWPAHGHGNLVHLEARVEGQLWPRAHAISLDTNIDSGVLAAAAFSCIFGNSRGSCSGAGSDWSVMMLRGGGTGQAVYAAPEDAGQWHCVTMHARLNTPGSADGVLEVSLDGVPQISDSDVDYRGTWDEVGFNTLTLPTWWPLAGPPSDMERFIDDIVLSTQPLACD